MEILRRQARRCSKRRPPWHRLQAIKLPLLACSKHPASSTPSRTASRECPELEERRPSERAPVARAPKVRNRASLVWERDRVREQARAARGWELDRGMAAARER